MIPLEPEETNTAILRYLHQVLIEIEMLNTPLLRLNLGPRAPEEVIKRGLEEMDRVRKRAAKEPRIGSPGHERGEGG